VIWRVLIVWLALGQALLGQTRYKVDLCVVQATPAGVACAVRAAREGLTVVLVNRTQHPGGILSSGLGVWDTIWEGKRYPIYDELRQSILDHYRETYGEDSSQYRHAIPGKNGHTNGKFEPRVVESLIREMILREPRISFMPGFIPTKVERSGRLLDAIHFREFEGEGRMIVEARSFADCTYEGDVMPLAKVAYRVGRESKEEFGEPHAGVIYMKSTRIRPAAIPEKSWKVHEDLNVRKFSGFQEILLPESTGEGDGNVQAFNYRTILTNVQTNQVPVVKPEDYDPAFLKILEYHSIVRPIPNGKIGWNRPQIVGLHQEYVEGDWETRKKVMDAHWNATMGLLWFMRTDPSVPEEKKDHWLRYALAKDEFPDNGHRPHEMYIREARRLEGRYMLTQLDLGPVEGTFRAPAFPDAIAFTDWYADSHAVTKGGVRGSLDEGEMMLHAETWLGQIPWRCLLPKEVDNLMVPVCFSATHVAWGAIRLEPTWMQIGEAAGHAAALAKSRNLHVAGIESEELVKRLVKNRFMVGFFNDVPVEKATEEVRAAQFFSTLGFFSDYDARLNEPMTVDLAAAWLKGFEEFEAGQLASSRMMRRVAKAQDSKSSKLDQTRGAFLVRLWRQL